MIIHLIRSFPDGISEYNEEVLFEMEVNQERGIVMTEEEYSERIYGLKLGEMFFPNNSSSWIRVPGGWVYGDLQGTCFIPFNNEFKPSPYKPKTK
jgi:hypothetical protein